MKIFKTILNMFACISLHYIFPLIEAAQTTFRLILIFSILPEKNQRTSNSTLFEKYNIEVNCGPPSKQEFINQLFTTHDAPTPI